jgi:hypothetical protein
MPHPRKRHSSIVDWMASDICKVWHLFLRWKYTAYIKIMIFILKTC